MKLFKTLIAAAIAASLLVVPAGALAKSRDRDHDRMPDKWEKKHHLNVHANDARKDPDHDHLSNLAEFRDHTNPRKADTDGDGINDGNEMRDHTNPRSDDSDRDGTKDGDEIAGTITSFQNALLTIQLPTAGSASGTVNDQTRIECDDDNGDAQTTPTTTARMSRDGRDGGDDNSGPGSSNDDGSDQDQGDDDNQAQCTSADLKPGAVVHEAKLTKAADGSNVFTKIELVSTGS